MPMYSKQYTVSIGKIKDFAAKDTDIVVTWKATARRHVHFVKVMYIECKNVQTNNCTLEYRISGGGG